VRCAASNPSLEHPPVRQLQEKKHLPDSTAGIVYKNLEIKLFVQCRKIVYMAYAHTVKVQNTQDEASTRLTSTPTQARCHHMDPQQLSQLTVSVCLSAGYILCTRLQAQKVTLML
jgi:hypothetical protein